MQSRRYGGYELDPAKGLDWSMRAVDRLLEASGGRGIFLRF